MSLKQTITYRYVWFKRKRSGYKVYKQNIKEYTAKNKREEFKINREFMYPILTDRFESAGRLGVYFWQDLWASRLIYKNKPKTHYDIGSRIDGFIGHLATFHDDIVLIDVRPLERSIPSVSFIQADATNLSQLADNSIESISALCSLEHFGLGRYGDAINPEACFEAFESIKRVTQKGGDVYISVPIGYEHLEFDAHRIFYPSTIVRAFQPFSLVEFSSVYENDDEIEKNLDIHKYDDEKDNRGLRFGLFHFKNI